MIATVPSHLLVFGSLLVVAGAAGYYAYIRRPSVAIVRKIRTRQREAARLGIRMKVETVVRIYGHPEPKGSRIFRADPLLCTIADFANVDKTYEVQWKREVVFQAAPGKDRRSEPEMVVRYAPGAWEAQLEIHFARAKKEAEHREVVIARRREEQMKRSWGDLGG
jgi:hypothetical protein